MNANFATFEKTLSGLSQGLQIRHIATFELAICTPDEHAAEVMGKYREFDQVPVKEDGRVVGVLERDGAYAQRVEDQMRRLDDSILVSAEEPLLDFIPLMAKPPYYRLVLSGSQVNGIVTRGDLLKLPVRLLGFAIVTNLELIMKEIISQQFSDDTAWMGLLSPGRQEKVKDKLKLYQDKHMDPSLIELTDYCDKITIIRKYYKFSKADASELTEVETLRNIIAHAGNYASDEAELIRFIQNLRIARQWIIDLSKYLR